jgi:hypothetical protein
MPPERRSIRKSAHHRAGVVDPAYTVETSSNPNDPIGLRLAGWKEANAERRGSFDRNARTGPPSPRGRGNTLTAPGITWSAECPPD